MNVKMMLTKKHNYGLVAKESLLYLDVNKLMLF